MCIYAEYFHSYKYISNICQSIQGLICRKLSHERAIGQISFRSNDCIKFRVLRGHFSTRRYPDLQNLSHLMYFCRNFSLSITWPHFGKTLISASFLSRLINKSRLNYENLTFSQATTNIFKSFEIKEITCFKIKNKFQFIRLIW